MLPSCLLFRKQIFDFIDASDPEIDFIVTCSICELYKEDIRDLLAEDENDLKIKESPTKGIYVEGLSQIVSTFTFACKLVSLLRRA